MTIQQLTQQPDDWNAYIADSPFGDILQSWEWGQVKQDELWQPLRLRVVEGQTIVGQAQILIRQLPLGFKLYYMPRGPVLDYAAESAPQVLATIFDWTKQHAKKNNGLLIKIGPPVSLDKAPNAVFYLQQLKLKPSTPSVQTKHTIVVDLLDNDNDLLASFDKDTRNLVRRAAKEGVIIDCFTQDTDTKPLRAFHNLYLATADRGQFIARPWSQMVRLWELMAPRHMAYLYTASFDDQALASSLVLRLGNTAYQLWAGSRRDTAKKFPSYALQWTIMQHMRQQGVKLYDMWGVAPTNDPNHSWAGITLFKKGFQGQQVDYIGDFDLPISPIYPLYQLAMSLRYKFINRN